jgi:phage gpG-like protein
MDIKIKVTGAEKIQNRLSRENVRAGIHAGVDKGVKIVAHSVMTEALTGQVLNRRTGNLLRNIRSDVSPPGPRVTGRVFVASGAPYGAIHEYGGVIVPRQAKALTFRVGGAWVRTQRVVMPERSFLRSTLARKKPEVIAIIEREVAQRLNGR